MLDGYCPLLNTTRLFRLACAKRYRYVDSFNGPLPAALVNQQHDRVHPLPLQAFRLGVRRRRFVEKRETFRSGGRDDPRRALQRFADEANFNAADGSDGCRREERRACGRANDVRRQILKGGAGEAVAVLAAVARMAAAAFHAQELGRAFVEFMIPD